MFRARHFLDTKCDLKLLIIVKLRNVSSLAKTNLPRLILKERERVKKHKYGEVFPQNGCRSSLRQCRIQKGRKNTVVEEQMGPR